jgi:flagellar biosynthesis protein FliP
VSSDGVAGAAAVAALAIVPLVVLMLTSFVKVSVVLSLLRNAIGVPDAPSGLVIMGVSLVLTFFVMAPVAIDMVRAAATPAPAGKPGDGSGSDTRGVRAAPDAAHAGGSGALVGRDGAGSGAVVGRDGGGSGAVVGRDEGGSGAVVGRDGVGSGALVGRDGVGSGAVVGRDSVGSGALVGRDGVGSGAPVGRDGAGSGASAEPRIVLDLDRAVRELVPARYGLQIDAAERALEPLRGFLERHAAARDRDTFVGVAQRMGRDAKGDELWVLAPAFLTTELREAFAIAVLIFIPFLVIDLVVGLGLAALGLQTTQPQAIALPLKLLLFVSVDGWRLLIDSLLRGYV